MEAQPDPIQQFIDAVEALGMAHARGEVAHGDLVSLATATAIMFRVSTPEMVHEAVRQFSGAATDLDKRIHRLAPVGLAVREAHRQSIARAVANA